MGNFDMHTFDEALKIVLAQGADFELKIGARDVGYLVQGLNTLLYTLDDLPLDDVMREHTAQTVRTLRDELVAMLCADPE
jgi:hypothetical protein